MTALSLFTVFHLNLAYSSIEEHQRAEVVRRCYWPLLEIAQRCRVPLGIEASGFTLATIQEIDPRWVATLRELTASGLVEFVGSGYAQIIGPLVPAEVNAANLRLGHATYERLLGLRPEIALLNEQAYSAGLLQHYIDAGYRAIIMEWDNPAMHHPEWKPIWRYSPQRACGQHDESLPVIWNQSIAFQKFQRFAHGEMELDELQQYLAGHLGSDDRAFALYGNDVEIFDFRPRRYHTEVKLRENGEWQRIRQLCEALATDDRFSLVRPSQVLELLSRPGAGQHLQLESARAPIPVKKQDKYNITRWAVTGRDDIGINTSCWRIFEAMRQQTNASDDDWRELCYLWSSDFRTHITAARWSVYRERLAACERRWSGARLSSQAQPKDVQEATTVRPALHAAEKPKLRHERHRLIVETDHLQLALNCRRGLSIDSLAFYDRSDWRPVCGTLPHGYFDSISHAADYYSGHLVLEAPGRHKITDLDAVEPLVECDSTDRSVIITGKIETPLGPVVKRFRIVEDRPLIELTYQLEWSTVPLGSLRLGYITLLPTSFDCSKLFFRTHQGGLQPETFRISPETPCDHGLPVSALVTAHQAVALTRGTIELGDTRGGLRIGIDHTVAGLVAMVQYSSVGSSFLCRLCFSAGEMDDTRAGIQTEPALSMQFSITLGPIVSAKKVVRHSAAVLPRQSYGSRSASHAIQS